MLSEHGMWLFEQRAFSHFDRDKSGTIDYGEFKHTLRVHCMLHVRHATRSITLTLGLLL